MISESQAHAYCRDDISKIENYDKAINDSQTWHLHHRLELTLDGEFALSVADLQMHDMYYNRPYYELIFLTPAEHVRLHSTRKARSAKSIQKKSDSISGENHPFYGRHHTEQSRKKISESKKGVTSKNKGKKLSPEHRRKLSESHKGLHQSEETRRKRSKSLTGRTLSTEHRRNISEAKRHHTAVSN